MATNTIELQGTLEWAKLFEGNRDKGEFDQETDGATTIDIILDDDNLAIMKAAGVRKQAKAADGGGHRVKFKRGWKDPFDRDWAAGAPNVFQPNGEAWAPDNGLIGNGSTGVVFVDVYDTKMGKGARLAGVQVITHVEFEGEGGGGSSVKPKDYTAGAAPSGAAAKTPVKQDMDDEIPF